MLEWRRTIPFKVDIAGIIEIMGSSLYSRSDTPIRELIQNAHDAVQRRRRRDLAYQGRIDIVQDAAAHTLTVEDDGIGLTADEAEKYLGTLGIGITGMIKRGHGAAPGNSSDDQNLIGQFGIGLFSAFMLAERLVVESCHLAGGECVRWEAGVGTEIELSNGSRTSPGTTVTLHLKPDFQFLAQAPDPVEAAIKEYADLLLVPIFLNHSSARCNVIHAAWFDAAADREAVELALEEYFSEPPLDVIPLRMEKPVSIAGALYFTPQRVPGFQGQSLVSVTLRRMVISRSIQGLLPDWAPFVRGVLELSDCVPTASREDLVRDATFEAVRSTLEGRLFSHLENLSRMDAPRLESILTWHHYHLLGAALEVPRLRALLRSTYRLHTSQGGLTFAEVFERSRAEPLFETDAERVVWYNGDRRQERWINSLFASREVPCVHALRSFEESLLASFVADANQEGTATDLRPASPHSSGFSQGVLGVHDQESAPAAWQDFLADTGAEILCASFAEVQPVMAFLNERYELYRTFDDLKRSGTIPSGFQRLIDSHFQQEPARRNEVLLNRNHRLVARALSQKTSSPLASVLRLLVHNALVSAGAALPRQAQRLQTEDLEWIAEALWGRTP